jgi:predicted Fe-S protein YdhL (DUF1289 family)
METPCINVCEIDKASGLCCGCGRTIAEIAGWAAMTGAERRQIMSELKTREFPRREGRR